MLGSPQSSQVEVEFIVNGVPLKFKLNKCTYPAGTGFFNWGQLDDAERRVAKGNIRGDANMVFQKAGDTTGYYNNGFYLSVSPGDSTAFGGFGIRMDFNLPEGIPFLDFGSLSDKENAAELKKFFIARGDYSENDDEAIAIYKKKLAKDRDKGAIDQDVYESKIKEIDEKKKTATVIKQELLSRATDESVCDIIDAMGHEKLKEAGVIGVTDTKNRQNWVSLVTDTVDHQVRFMKPDDFKVTEVADKIAKLRQEREERLAKAPDVEARKVIEAEYERKKDEIIKSAPIKDWSERVRLSTLFAIDAKIPFPPEIMGSFKKLKDKLYATPMSQVIMEDLLTAYAEGVSSGASSAWDKDDKLRLNPAEEMDNNQQNRALRSAPPYIKTPLQDDLYKVIVKFMKENPGYTLPENLQAEFQRLEETHQHGLEMNEQELRMHFMRNGPTHDGFLKQLIYGLNFVDGYDYLRKMALGDGMPWAAYDPWGAAGHNLGKWQQAIKVSYSPDKQKPTDGIVEIFKIFREASQIKFRGHEVIAGGPFDKQGKLIEGDTSEGQGYFRVTAEQLEVLKKHRFIDVVDAIAIDPPVEGAGFLVRYRYPDARDYEKLKDLAPNFYQAIQDEIGRLGKEEVDKLLKEGFPSKLAGELDRAGKDPLDPNNIDPKYHFFMKYTNLLVGELFQGLDKKMSAEERYQLMLTLHPFFDTNGRSARAFYQVETGKPFMMANWDFDILYTPAQLKHAIDKGISDWARFVGEWKKESTQAYIEQRPPAYYQQPQIWLRLAGIDPTKYTSDEQKQIMRAVEAVFKTPEFAQLQEKKAWFDCQALLHKELKPVLDQINKPKLEEEAKYKPLETQKHKAKKVIEELNALKGKEPEAKVKGVVVSEPSHGLKKLQEPAHRERMKQKEKERNKKGHLLWRKDHALKDKADVPQVAQHFDKQASEYYNKLFNDQLHTLAISNRNALDAQLALVREKLKENERSNPYWQRFLSYYYASYYDQLKKVETLLSDGKKLTDKYLEKLEEGEFKDMAEARAALNEINSNLNHIFNSLDYKDQETGVGIKKLFDSMHSQLEEMKETMDKHFEKAASSRRPSMPSN